MKPALFIIARPTPQRAPVLDEMAARGLPMKVIYVQSDEAEQGWGRLELRHPHVFVGRGVSPWTVTRELMRGEYSVLVSMGYRQPIHVAALTAARMSKTPIAMRFDTNQLQIEASDSIRRAARRMTMRAVIPRGATAWAIGTQNARFWRQEIRLRAIASIPYEVPVLPGGITSAEITRPRTSDPQSLRFLYVGRLTPIKNVAEAIEAFLDIRHPGWSLSIVGSGPQADALQRLARDDSRVTFLGSLSYTDLGAVFANSDVLVLPSRGEPWGLVVNEALGYGLRVIASDQVGAAYDLLTPEVGEIYPVGDVAALASAMQNSVHHLTQAPRGPETDTAALMMASIRQLAGGA